LSTLIFVAVLIFVPVAIFVPVSVQALPLGSPRTRQQVAQAGTRL
jgi:hypothetical protein